MTSFDMTAPRCFLVRPAGPATAEPFALVEQLPRHGIDLRCLVRDTDVNAALHEQGAAAVLIASFDASEAVLQLCRSLHDQGQAAVLALTPAGDDTIRILALESGADDCVEETSDAREVAADSRAVDLLVSRLRQKLHARDPHQPLIQTVRGRGYRLDLSTIDTQTT